jgi:integrase
LEIKPENSFFSDGRKTVQESQSPSLSAVGNNSNESNNLATLSLEYSKEELESYRAFRIAGVSRASIPWILKCAETFWNVTRGHLNKGNIIALRDYVLTKYSDFYAQRKVLNFSKAFLKHLAKTRFDLRYAAFDLYLELPKSPKTRKRVTSRILTKLDVENVLRAIERAYEIQEIDRYQRLNYTAIVLFSAFTGQRPEATTARLTIGQFRATINQQKPVVDVLPEQDKIRMQHYCPLHP